VSPRTGVSEITLAAVSAQAAPERFLLEPFRHGMASDREAGPLCPLRREIGGPAVDNRRSALDRDRPRDLDVVEHEHLDPEVRVL
jgi:hypothetical protein